MTLASAYAGIVAGCVSVPQHGYFAFEPLARYQVTFVRPGQRVFYRFNYDVQIEWDCPSPPAQIRITMREKPSETVNTDPIWHCDAFLTSCSSPGTALGTSLWFTCVSLNCNFRGNPLFFANWIHIQNWKTNVGSIGLVTPASWPPAWPL